MTDSKDTHYKTINFLLTILEGLVEETILMIKIFNSDTMTDEKLKTGKLMMNNLIEALRKPNNDNTEMYAGKIDPAYAVTNNKIGINILQMINSTLTELIEA